MDQPLAAADRKQMLSLLQGGGEMGRLIRQFNWNGTTTGDPAAWPASLLITLNTLLHSPSPMLLCWGNDLTCFYNDAFRSFWEASGIHPDFLGKCGADAFTGVLHFIGPLIRRVQENGEPSLHKGQVMPAAEYGLAATKRCTLACSPVKEPDGRTGGVLVVCTESLEKAPDPDGREKQIQSPSVLLKNKKPVMEETSQSWEILQRSHERFKAAVKAVQGVLWTNNPSGQMEGEQPGWAELTGQSYDEYQGFGWAKAVHPDDAQPTINAWNEAVMQKKTFVFEHRIRRRNGEWGHFSVRAVPLLNGDGGIVEWVGVHTDITEQRKAEEGLVYQKRLLEAVTSNTSLALFLMDDRQQCVYMNEAAEEMTGFNLEELQGRQLHYYVHHSHPDGRHYPLEECPIDQALPRQMRMKGEEVFVHKNGSFYPVAFTASPIMINGTPVGTVIEVRDTTEEKKKEKALKENEERFRATFENAAVGIAHIGLDGSWLMVNDRLCKILGYSRDELAHCTFQDITHPDDLSKDMELVQQILGGQKETYTIEKRYVRRDGSSIWVNLTVSLVRNKDGSPKYFISVLQEVGDRKQTEEALKESEERFRVTFENAAVGISLLDVEEKWQIVNKRLCEITGYSKEELHKLNYRHITHPDDLEKDLALMEEVMEGRLQTYTLEKRYLHKKGNTVWINMTLSLVRNREGEPKYTIVIIEDISQRKKAEIAMSESEERFRNIFESVPVSLWEEDFSEVVTSLRKLQQQHGADLISFLQTNPGVVRQLQAQVKIKDTNNASLELFEASSKQQLLSGLHTIFSEEAYSSFTDQLTAILNNQASLRKEYVLKTLKGRELHTLVTIHFSNTNDYSGVLVSVHDITERKRAEQELEALVQQRTAELHSSNQDLQQFAHVASHDLKEPVRKIRTFASRLQGDKNTVLSENGKVFLHKIERSAQRMYDMIDGVLNYSTLSATEAEPSEVDLQELISHIEGDLEVVIQQKKARILYKNLPVVQGAPVLFHQLFYNLVNNSLKFSKPDLPPQINIVAETVQEGKQHFVRIHVKDNGIGFEQEYASRIFDTFTRLNAKDKYEGTGLGLSLCKKIVERHGGAIEANGSPGKGAEIILTLPGIRKNEEIDPLPTALQ